jgi:hypothetical protein
MSNKWYNDIRSELNEREQQCNDKVVYEYTRPKTDPYSYKNVDEFKTSNPYSTEKSCKILITDQEYEQDKYKRYYKDVYTKNKCKIAKGFWVGDTINRNNTYDKGNCWVNDDDAECGKLLNSNKLLRNSNSTKQQLKDAKNKCEINPKCSFKQINKNSRDCIAKRHIPDKPINIKIASISPTKPQIDINNLEKSLYDFYNNKDAPKTLELIGKGNRCVENTDDESESQYRDFELALIDNIEKDIPIEELSIANLSTYREDYINYSKYLIIGLNPNYEDDADIILTEYFNNNQRSFDDYIREFNLYTDELRKRTIYGNTYEANMKYMYMWTLYYDFFPKIFFKEINNSKQVNAHKYIYLQYMKNFILSLDPNNETDIISIKPLMTDSSNFNDFLQQYNDSKGTNKIDIYYTYFTKFFIEAIAHKNKEAKKGYIKYIRILIYNSNPNISDDVNIILKYMAKPEQLNDFIKAYNDNDNDDDNIDGENKLRTIYYTYFPEYFDVYKNNMEKAVVLYDKTMKEKTILYFQNKIELLDPNIKEEYDELRKYIVKDTLMSKYKTNYNLTDYDDKEALNKLYQIYFPTYFNKNIDFTSSFYTSSILDSSSSVSSSKSPIKNNSGKLPTVPQSIVNNICEIINTQKLDKRGMLLWHSTGSGKTCTATAIMNGFWTSGKRIIYCSSVDALINNPPYKFHECAANLFPQFYGKSLEKINKEFIANKVDFLTFAKLANRIEKKLINLNDCILIIDEVHNLFRPLSHQKKQYTLLEKLLLNSTKLPKLKVFILTATLGDNTDEIMKLLNIVKDINVPLIKFDDINDESLFKQKIRGLISHFDMSSDTTKFPTVYEKDPKIVDMSLKQFEKYITAYKEVKEGVKNYDNLAKNNSLNKFWAPARKYSNMLFNYDKGLSLHDFSAKLETLINTINDMEYVNDKHYVYSAFYENRGYGGQGILAVAREFTKLGYEQLTPAEATKIYNNPTELNKKPRFILAITTQLGNDKGKDLDEMRKLYNAPFNRHGEYVKLFLASQTFNEGLDLKAVRHIHIFEPLITWASDKQTIGRAARYCSHSDLQKKDWTVTIHRYLSNFPTIQTAPDITIDETQYEALQKAIEKATIEIEENKKIITGYKKLITDNKKTLKKATGTNKDKIIDTMEQLEVEIVKINDKNESIKTSLKIQKTEFKKIEKVIKSAKKPKKDAFTVDATNIENIDKFIFQQSQEKMKGILTLYQYMQEAAVDCMVLQAFHKNGNKDIKCEIY